MSDAAAWRRLSPHPAARPPAGLSLAAAARRPGPGALWLCFRLSGDIARLVLPAPAQSARVDGLWRGTCFEAFLSGPARAGYVELNLSPSSEWAAYTFTGYRAGMAAAALTAEPTVTLSQEAAGLTLTAELGLAHATGLEPAGPWRIGLAAVIEETGAPLSYWALVHSAGRPDFHHGDGFALDLALEEPR